MDQRRDSSPRDEPKPFSDSEEPSGGRLALVVAALAGALLAWGLVEHFHLNGYFVPAEPPPELANRSETDPELQAKEDELARVALYGNSMLLLGLVGACLGAFLGSAEALRRRSLRALGPRFLVGVLSGAVLGAFGGFAQVFVGLAIDDFARLGLTIRAMIMHAIAWILTGCGVALAICLPPSRGRGVLMVVFGASSAGLIAGLLYAPLAAILFPLSQADRAVPTGSTNRLLFLALAAGLIGLALGRTGDSRRISGTKPPAAPDARALS